MVSERQTLVEKIAFVVVFRHLQKVTHGLGVPVVGLGLTLHYHDLPWQVPGNAY